MTRNASKKLRRLAASWSGARRIERQARLMGEVMERLAVDPAAAAQQDGGVALAAACRRCLFCGKAEACRFWLDRGGSEAAPAFCANAAYFDRLRRSLPETAEV